MAGSITVTKTAADTFEMKFDSPVRFPGSDSDEVPAEWLRGVLDYYISVNDAGTDDTGSDVHPDW